MKRIFQSISVVAAFALSAFAAEQIANPFDTFSAIKTRLVSTEVTTDDLSNLHDGTLSASTVAATTSLTVGSGGTAVSKVVHGTVALTAGRATVSNTNVLTGSLIFLTAQNGVTTNGFLWVYNRTNGASFSIASSQTGETNAVSYLIINP